MHYCGSSVRYIPTAHHYVSLKSENTGSLKRFVTTPSPSRKAFPITLQCDENLVAKKLARDSIVCTDQNQAALAMSEIYQLPTMV